MGNPFLALIESQSAISSAIFIVNIGWVPECADDSVAHPASLWCMINRGTPNDQLALGTGLPSRIACTAFNTIERE